MSNIHGHNPFSNDSMLECVFKFLVSFNTWSESQYCELRPRAHDGITPTELFG